MKKEKGITLLALIVTIIILVILAGVTIKTLFGDNLIEIATKARDDFDKAQTDEVKKLEDIGNYVDKKAEEALNPGGKKDPSNPENPTPPGSSNHIPTITAEYANDKGTDYIRIKATGEDEDIDDKLIYTLYVSEDEENWGEAKEITEPTTPGTPVTLTASGLDEYTDYYWKVGVTDGKNESETERKTQVRTYCSGMGLTCEGPFIGKVICSSCNGNYNKYEMRTRKLSLTQTKNYPYTNNSGPCYICEKYVDASSAVCPAWVCTNHPTEEGAGYYAVRCCSLSCAVEAGKEKCEQDGVSYTEPLPGSQHVYWTCPICNNGKVDGAVECVHGLTASHQHCSHEKMIKHDE